MKALTSPAPRPAGHRSVSRHGPTPRPSVRRRLDRRLSENESAPDGRPLQRGRDEEQ